MRIFHRRVCVSAEAPARTHLMMIEEMGTEARDPPAAGDVITEERD